MLMCSVRAIVQALYGPLTSTSPGVQREGEQLPTFEQLAQRVQANMKITVRDVWGLMLTALPGGFTVHRCCRNKRVSKCGIMLETCACALSVVHHDMCLFVLPISASRKGSGLLCCLGICVLQPR